MVTYSTALSLSLSLSISFAHSPSDAVRSINGGAGNWDGSESELNWRDSSIPVRIERVANLILDNAGKDVTSGFFLSRMFSSALLGPFVRNTWYDCCRAYTGGICPTDVDFLITLVV